LRIGAVGLLLARASSSPALDVGAPGRIGGYALAVVVDVAAFISRSGRGEREERRS
jgi:hypothetical protein